MKTQVGQYFLYKHTTIDTNEVFYIGRGTKSKKVANVYIRAFVKNTRTLFWKNIVNKYGYKIDIILESDDFYFICAKEKEFIALYGRRNLNKGTLVNLSDGGDTGGLGRIYKPTPETIEKVRKAITGRKMPDGFGESVTKRMLGNKYRLNTKASQSAIDASRRKTMIPVFMYNLSGKFIKRFNSVKEAADFIGIDSCSITCCLKQVQKQTNGYQFKYIYTETCTPVNYKIKYMKAIIHTNLITGETTNYDTTKEAALALGINWKKIHHNLYGESKIVEKIHQFKYLNK